MTDLGRGPRAARVGVLVAAGGSGWEPRALEAFARPGRVTLVKRCLDLPDLLATAATGTAQVAVVSDQLAGLDADTVGRLAREGVRTVAVGSATTGRAAADEAVGSRVRLLRIGVDRVVDEDAVDTLAQHVLAAADQESTRSSPTAAGGVSEPVTGPGGILDDAPAGRTGRLVAVWGPTGAPGRTTVAIGLAAESAARGLSVLLADVDPYGGAVGQHLAVLDEVSGLLAATRLANSGHLDRTRLAGLAREVAPGLRLLTGLPRPDRWVEVRPQALVEVLAAARALDDIVVVDTGFGLPVAPLDPYAGSPGRDETTRTIVETADDLVVVGSADPVGITRLVRSLRDVGEVRAAGADVVVVNRMRSSLGWSTREIGDLVHQVAPQARLTFLPDDRIAVDRSVVAGRTLLETGDSPLRRAMADLAGLVPSVNA